MNFKCIDHFLDTNILIASRIDWDVHFNNATEYMIEKNIKRHASKMTHEEADNVFGHMRQNIRAFLVSYLGNQTRPPMMSITDFVSRQITNFEKRCKSTSNYMYNKKVWRSIESYIRKNLTRIQDAAAGGKSELIKLANEADKYIQSAIDSLLLDCKDDPNAKIHEHSNCPPDYLNYNGYGALYNALYDKKDTNKISNSDDVRILLDSFFVMNETKKEMHFVTFDKSDIIDHQSLIEKTLNGIYVIEPDYPKVTKV